MKMQLFRHGQQEYLEYKTDVRQTASGSLPFHPPHCTACAFQLCTLLTSCFLTLSVQRKIACHPHLTAAFRKEFTGSGER